MYAYERKYYAHVQVRRPVPSSVLTGIRLDPDGIDK